MSNPRPKQTEIFKQKRFQRLDLDDEDLAARVRGVRLPESVDRLVERAFSTTALRAAWLRSAIREAAIQELLPKQQQVARELLAQGVALEQVAMTTGLSVTELQAICKNQH